MEKTQEELQAVVQKILTEKTFSTEAMEAIAQMQKDFSQALVNVDQYKKWWTDEGKKNKELITENDTLKAAAASVAQREAAVTEREKKMDLLDLTIKYEQTRVQDIKSFIETVFRNTIVRKNVSQSIPVPTAGGYPTSMSGSETHETIEE